MSEGHDYRDDAPAELTPKQLRARNKALAALGRRICRTHQGEALPLTAEYFYTRSDGGFHTECKRCFKARSVANLRKRYQTDAAYRQRERARVMERRQANPQPYRDYTSAWKRKHKAALFARIMQEQGEAR